MAEVFRFADLELDTARFQIRRRGEIVAAEPQVFDVLHYLVRHHDRVVTKDELLEKVWSGRFISETTLSSRIKAVRQLIGDTGKDQVLLRTLRNRGFRFVGEVTVSLADARAIVSRPEGPSEEMRVPGVAVLPFDAVGDDAGHGHLGEGIAADIISLLAHHHWLMVISRGSSFAFRGGQQSPRQIGAELGVRYIVTGRTQRHAGRIRIDAELADCETGMHLWSHRYDRDQSDFFALQEEISAQIAATIEPRLSELEQRRATAKPPADLNAWECVQRGLWHLYRFTTDDLITADTWFRRAIDIEPTLARAHASLAYVALQLAFYGNSVERDGHLRAALESAQRAVSLDGWDAFNRFTLGRSLCLLLEFPEAEAELQAAIDFNPSFAQAWFALGFCYTNWDRPREALPLYEKARTLSPNDPHLWTFHHMRGMAHYRLGEMDDAESSARAAVRQQNATYWPFATLCSILGDLARIDDARAIANRLTGMESGYSCARCREDFFFTRDDEFVDRYVAGLRAAGIPP
jgi:TolB-like protein/Flp pilus assembly protein TadD